jgi:predicted HD superfamily hydrolase involved in NAD metabolism
MTLPTPEACLPALRNLLSPARLAHSLGVMGVMQKLAPVYGLDPARAALAGLLHDAAKELVEAEYLAIVRRRGVQVNEACEWDYNCYLHGPVGAAFVEERFDIHDPALLDAIYSHTFFPGPNFHAPLNWCLRFADLLEPNRAWTNVPWMAENCKALMPIVRSGDLPRAALLQAEWVIRLFRELGVPVNRALATIHAGDFEPGGAPARPGGQQV